MKFMNTTKALGVSAIALGFVAGMAQEAAAAGELNGFYRVEQTCKVDFANGDTMGTSKTLYARVKDEGVSPDFPVQALILDRQWDRKIAYDGGYQTQMPINGRPGNYIATLDACTAFEGLNTSQPLGYSESIKLEGTTNKNLASDSVQSYVQSYTSGAITKRYCQYVFIKDNTVAAYFKTQPLIDCPPAT